MVTGCTGRSQPMAEWHLTWEPQQNGALLLEFFADFFGYPNREKREGPRMSLPAKVKFPS